jgi:conflict system STAND superfamily ATPase
VDGAPPSAAVKPDGDASGAFRPGPITIDSDTIEITHEALLTAWPRLREW